MARELDCLLDPSCVAIVGASEDLGKFGGRALANLIEGGYQGRIVPINRTRETLRGLACFAAIGDVPGDVDVAVLGGLQVSERGDLANWFVPERGGGSVGGAMDLAVGARRLIVAMAHRTREGGPRIVRECSYPLTAPACVDLIVTDLSVIEVTPAGLLLREVAPGVSAGEVQAATEPELVLADDLHEMAL